MKTMLLIDYSNIVIRGMMAVPPLTFQGKATGGLYGFITQSAKYINAWKPTHVAICTDSYPYLRQQFFPQYKGDRKKENASMFFDTYRETKKYCADLVERIGIPFIKIQGFEADDLFMFFSKKYHAQFDKIIIVSNDSDLIQLFQFDNVILDRGKKGVYTKNDYYKEYDLILEDFWKVGAIAGTHNAVPQLIKRVGEKTALKIVKDPQKWDPIYEEHKESIERNRKLIELPFEELQDDSVLKFTRPDFRVNNILLFLEKFYGIHITNAMEFFFTKLVKDINVVEA